MSNFKFAESSIDNINKVVIVGEIATVIANISTFDFGAFLIPVNLKHILKVRCMESQELRPIDKATLSKRTPLSVSLSLSLSDAWASHTKGWREADRA